MVPSIAAFQLTCPVTRREIRLSYVSPISETNTRTTHHTCVEKWTCEQATEAAANGSVDSTIPTIKRKDFCLKRVPCQDRDRLLQEVAWLTYCSAMLYPSLPTIYAAVDFGAEMAILMEYLPAHDLFEWTPSSFPHGFDVWFATAVAALHCLSLLNVAHNDISVENLSCRVESGMCVIIDFEHASHYYANHHRFIPTKLRNRAPELSHIGDFNKANKHLSDLFALGVSCAQICLRGTKCAQSLWTSLHATKESMRPQKIAELMTTMDMVAPAKQAPAIVSLLCMSPTHRMKAYERIENALLVK